MSEKIIVIGLDGATFDVIIPMIQRGKLPNIAEVMKDGTSGELISTIPSDTPPAWSSFMTGKYPDKHGVFYFNHHSPNPLELKFRPVNSTSIKTDTLWDNLSRNSKRMILINVPLTYPTPKINGIVISGLMTPPNRDDYIYPPEMRDEINKIAGGYRLDPNPLENPATLGITPEQWISELFDIEEKRGKVAKYLLNNASWDFFMVVFSLTDRISHRCWEQYNCMDKSIDPVSKAYKTVDRLIGELLSGVDKKTSLIILSDHGFGAVKRIFFTNRGNCEACKRGT